tara:strand:+ start:65 stop:1156 length:1092 start_codon:yes stop_codon:yes gene_type:complete
MKAFVDNEFKKSYPQIDLFAVDHSEIETVSYRIENDTVVIYYADAPPYQGLDVFFRLFSQHEHKIFHMFTMPADWSKMCEWPVNVYWHHYNFAPHSHNTDDILGGYRTLERVKKKSMNSRRVGICLNRLPRTHRLVSLSYMLGRELNQHCIITAPLLKWHLGYNHVNIMDSVSWNFAKHEKFKTLMLEGWESAKRGVGIVNVKADAYPPYDDLEPNQTLFNNPENFTKNLVPLYENSFVEFVTESVYEYNIAWVSEKLLNSQLGSNFPIWISGKGTVSWLRDRGFDVFDDIVDHNYDTVEDPVLRMQQCIDLNWVLLSDHQRTKKLWRKNQRRFQNNVDWYITTYDKLLQNGRKTLENLLCAK